jgi:hypothetical protein
MEMQTNESKRSVCSSDYFLPDDVIRTAKYNSFRGCGTVLKNKNRRKTREDP